MKRREFMTATAAGRLRCAAARARSNRQDGSTGWGTSSIVSRERIALFIKAFEDGLRSLGYRVGENVTIEYRFANGEMERLPALAADWSGSVWTSSSPGSIRSR